MRPVTNHSGSNGLRVALWITQALLAVAFGLAGAMKISQPIPALTASLGWPGALPSALVRFIGTSELAAAVGLVLPGLIRVRPVLTPIAALGIVVIMVLATGFHLIRAEFHALPITGIFASLALFVAWGRWRKAPIHER